MGDFLGKWAKSGCSTRFLWKKCRPEGTVAPKYGTFYGIGQSLVAVHGPCGKMPVRRHCSSQIRHFLWNWQRLVAVHGPCGKMPARRYCSSQVRHFFYGIGQSLVAVHGSCGKIPVRRYCSYQVRNFLWNWAKSGCSTRFL